MDEQQRAVIGVGGAAQRAQQRYGRDGLHGRAQLAGPARDAQRPVAGRSQALLGFAAIGAQGRADALLHHPGQHLARDWARTAAAAASATSPPGCRADRRRRRRTCRGRAMSSRRKRASRRSWRDIAAVAEIVAEIDEPVAGGEARLERVVQRGAAAPPRHGWRQRPRPAALRNTANSVTARFIVAVNDKRSAVGTAPCARRKETARAANVPRGRRARAAGLGGLQHLLEPLRRGHLVDPLDGGELAHQPVERRLIDLPLAVGLVGLVGVAVQVAHHLGDRARDRPN